MKVEIDCKGQACPQPVLKAREALLENPGDVVAVTVDNEASRKNLERFGQSQHCAVQSESIEGGFFVVTLIPGEKTSVGVVDENAYSCEVGDSTGLVYVIASDTMGRGDDTLGKSLLKTFLQTIKDVSPQPSKIIFYNSGVRLVCEGSAALEALRSLQENGVNILACGTCLEFYELKAEIKVGQISNMYEIMTTMMEASRVVSPQ